MRIGFREASREEDRALELVAIAEAEEQFESRVRAGHPIAIDRKVKLRGSDCPMSVSIDGMEMCGTTPGHYEWLPRMTGKLDGR